MIIVFDSKCLLCNASVQFLLRHDRQGIFKFASMQGKSGQLLLAQAGLRLDKLETLLLVKGSRSWQHSAAILRVMHELGWPWRAAWIAWVIPSPIRDTVYRWIARNRYRLFGRSNECLMPPTDYLTRFLD